MLYTEWRGRETEFLDIWHDNVIPLKPFSTVYGSKNHARIFYQIKVLF